MYRQYTDDIFRFFLAHTRDVQLSEDLTADTFTKAWDKLDTFDGRHARGWLYKIAQNKLTDHWRLKKPLPLDEDIDIIDERKSTEDRVDEALERERIQGALAKLPEQMRSVVALRFMQGYSARETAEALDMSESNVRVMQHRALKKLQGILS